MKKVNMVYVDGFYRTEKEARKLHPEGYDTKYTKTEYVETLSDKIRYTGETFFLHFLFWLILFGLTAIETYLILRYFGIV